ncbi:MULTISPECIES: hypothetical protein [unclassified Moorena]|uniref:hypothetical protein n=1 Tax=unclassified Moorena TaxID=2683338 RepID=UPI0013C11E39|nr:MULTISPECIES: hypothetical protein [unclassified Moorena]NES44916.1 hypothetical protein [Moorena sp. SIO2C4]NET67057.1 hypothetical protein [Moorena sp. SIO1G6]
MKHIVAAFTIVGITVAQGFTNKLIADQLPLGTVDTAQGVGKIFRLSENVSIPVSIGEELYRGDLLRIDKGAYVVIECHNNNNNNKWTIPEWTIPEGILVGVNNGCERPINPFSGNPPKKGGFYPPNDGLGPFGDSKDAGTGSR